MSELISSTKSDPVPSSRTRRSRRKRPASRAWWIGLGTAAALVLGGVFGFSAWLKHYVQSDAFRIWLGRELSRRLDADITLDGLRWQDSSGWVATVEGAGYQEAPFAALKAWDIRADVNSGAIWDRTWQIDAVKVARAFLDLSGKNAPHQDAGLGVSQPAPRRSGFFDSLLPDKTVIKGITVDDFGFTWTGSGRSASAREIGLEIKPVGAIGGALVATGSGGTLSLSDLPGLPVEVQTFDASWQDGELRLDQLSAKAGGARVRADAALLMAEPPSFHVTGEVEDMDLARCIPEDWLKKLTGQARGNVKISGDPRQPARWLWQGDVQLGNAMLQGLPILGIIARKTQNESFTRLLLKEASCNFTRTPQAAWSLEKINIDATGLLRLKGMASASPQGTLGGTLLLGIVPGTLRYLAGAEQQVFLPPGRAGFTDTERASLSTDDEGLLWTRLRLSGTLSLPEEDLSDRLARAWFNATVDEVLSMNLEGALHAAQAASSAAGKAAGTLIEKAPDIIDAGSSLIKDGVDAGLKAAEGLLPR